MTPGVAFFVGLRARLWMGCLLAPFVAFGAGGLFPDVQHVVHISVDGLGGYYLSNYVAEAPGQFATFSRIRREGSTTLNARCDHHYSITEPNHTCMLTGRPVVQQPDNVAFNAPHGMTYNYDPGEPYTLHNLGNPAVPYKASTLDVVHDHGLSTAFFAGKEKFALFVRSYDAVNGAPDLVGENNGKNKVDHSTIIDWADPVTFRTQSANLITLVTNQLISASPGYTFLHIADPDIAGHYYGWGSQMYRDTVAHVDGLLNRILSAIDATPELRGRTAVVVTADHGGFDFGHSTPDDWRVFTIPLLMWGPGVVSGRDLYQLFANRTDPARQYLDYNAPLQPLRNGDSGNLSLALLGLPSIPDSIMIPEFKPWLSFARSTQFLTVSWPGTSTSWDLQQSDLSPGSTWQTVTDGVTQSNGRYSLRVTNSIGTSPAQFFRLKQAQ